MNFWPHFAQLWYEFGGVQYSDLYIMNLNIYGFHESWHIEAILVL